MTFEYITAKVLNFHRQNSRFNIFLMKILVFFPEMH